jgi:3-isopropylmalate/(R)-2-methylmalate dehydratase small subunit
MKVEGRAWKFGDNVDTDLIIPARYLNVWDKALLAEKCFVDLRPGFKEAVKAGDIVVAGSNFGCGSSREHAPLAIKTLGVGAVIAKSFARIFYRNAFNIGLPILESEEAGDAIEEGDTVAVNFKTGEIVNRVKETRYFAKPIPDFMREIIKAGGLVAYIKKRQS